jgi:hypothetical protein
MRCGLCLGLLVVIVQLVSGVVRAEPASIAPAVLAAALKTATCDVTLSEATANLQTYELGNGWLLIEARCWRAVYNFASILLVRSPIRSRQPRLQRFALWTPAGFADTYSLAAPQFDPGSHELTMRHQDSAGGDCGTIGQWVWSGSRFRLSGFWNKPECDGEEFEIEDRWRVFPRRP